MNLVDRRSFLKTLTATGSLAWAAGPVSALAQNGYGSPVPFLQSAEDAGLSQADVNVLFTMDPAQTAAAQALVFPQSVGSGDPRPNGAVLWTRVDPAQRGGRTPTWWPGRSRGTRRSRPRRSWRMG